MKFTILKKVTGSGAPAPKSKFAFLARLREIEFFPPTDSLGVVLLGDIKLKENCGMMQLYITPSSQEYGYEVSGDSDSKGHKVKFNGTHPGTEQQALEFVTNYLEEEFVILIPDCDKGIRVLGSPDAPLIFTSSHKSSKDSQKFNFIFEQEVATDFIYRLYDGIITLNENIDIDMSDFLEALKNYIKIDGSNLSDAQKQNLRQILGLDSNAGNIGNQDLQLNENRSFNLKSFFLNFFSNSGTAKVGINKNNPETALDVVGGITTDDLKLKKNGNLVSVAIVDAGENPETYSKSQILEVIDSDFVGVVYPTDPTPTIEGSYEPALSSEDGKDINPDDYGTIYPNIQNFKSKAGYRTRFVLKNGVWTKSEVEMPTVQVDQVFNPDSTDPVATREVAKRYDGSLKALNYFIQDTVLAEDLTGSFGDHTIYFKDLTPAIVGDPDNSSIYKYDLTGIDYIFLEFRVPDYANYHLYTCITFEKVDGTLYEYKAPNPVEIVEIFSKKIIVTDYKNITISWSIHGGPIVFRAYKGEGIVIDGVKKYIDKNALPFKSFVDGVISPKLVRTIDKTEINSNPFINNVQTYINQHLLMINNNVKTFDDPDFKFFIWKDIPTKISNKRRLVRIDLEIIRIGGELNTNTNLLGIKKDGTIVNLIGSLLVTPTSKIEKFSIDLKPYEKFSLQILLSDTISPSEFAKTKIKLFENSETQEDSLLHFIEENGGKGGNKIVSDKLIGISKPTTAPIINIIGELPTDNSPTRTPTNVEIEYITDNKIIFKCKASLAIQGNATATFAKKGFEAILKNYNDEELKIQYGKWPAFSEFHWKAYPNDQTFARDLTAGKLWHQIRKTNVFPKSYIADFNAGQAVDINKENLQEQALFYTDGFAFELRLNGVFYGLYINRIKKDRDNYMMNNANPNHIFLDNEESVNWTTFTPSNWKLRSPKVSGELSNPTLLAKINRWWDWFKGINDGTVDFEATVNQYLNVDSWVDDMILQQVTGHWDYQTNNILLTSWDGLKLSICYYDGDQTFGFVLNSMGGFEFPLTVDSNGLYWRADFWRTKLYPRLKTRIQTRYTELRNKGVLETNNVYKLFKETTDLIPRDLYEKEFQKWRIIRPDEGIHNVRYCVNWFDERLKKLDLIWKI